MKIGTHPRGMMKVLMNWITIDGYSAKPNKEMDINNTNAAAVIRICNINGRFCNLIYVYINAVLVMASDGSRFNEDANH